MGDSGERLIRRPAVRAKTGLPTSTLYDYMERGDFPRPVKLSSTSVAWVESEVDAWIATRIRDSRDAA